MDKVCHNLFTKSQLKSKEVEIFQTLNYSINIISLHEFVQMIFYQTEIKYKMSEKIFERFEKMTNYLLMIIYHDINLLNRNNFETIANSIFFISLKMIEKIIERVDKNVSIFEIVIIIKKKKNCFLTSFLIKFLIKDKKISKQS